MFPFWIHITQNFTKSNIISFQNGCKLYRNTVGINDIDFNCNDDGLILEINSGELLILHYIPIPNNQVINALEKIKQQFSLIGSAA